MTRRNYWLLALGAALVSFSIIGASHCWQLYPPWANEQFSQGWMIYPPLSALPQALPEPGVTMEQYYGYLGLLAGSTVAAVVALLCWLVGVLVSKPAGEPPRTIVVKLLPVLLLVPCFIHLVGTKRAYDQSRREQAVITNFLLQQELAERTADSLAARSQEVAGDSLERLK